MISLHLKTAIAAVAKAAEPPPVEGKTKAFDHYFEVELSDQMQKTSLIGRSGL